MEYPFYTWQISKKIQLRLITAEELDYIQGFCKNLDHVLSSSLSIGLLKQ